MRVRTDDRRNAIIDVATPMFRELGYARTSMAMISARVGGSKGTLYGYFKSKEDLFAASMMAVVAGQLNEALSLLDPSEPNIEISLRKFGKSYLALLTSVDALSIIRTTIAEGSNSTLGAKLYAAGAEQAWHDVQMFLGQFQKDGVLRPAKPSILAAQLKGLLEAGVVEPLLFGAETWISAEEAVAHAVDVFMQAYAIRRQPEPG